MNKIISHRGNLAGPDPKTENTLEQIEIVLSATDFDIEIDVNAQDNKIFLGHNYPKEHIPIKFLLKNSERLWLHCKDADMYDILTRYRDFGKFVFNFFFHANDRYVLTSRGWIWGFPYAGSSNNKISNERYVHIFNDSFIDPSYMFPCENICTDHPLEEQENYKKTYG